MKALVIGATGSTGKSLVKQLLEDETYSSVTIFVRKDISLIHPKLHTHIIQFDQPNEWQELVQGDVLFSCLGTTKKLAGSQDAQYTVDFTYQYQFAQAAKANGVKSLVLVSSANASPTSRFFYLKMKGELEVAVKQLNFQSLIIFRPPLLIREQSDRAGEKLGEYILGFFNSIGLLKKMTPMKTADLATAMILSSKQNSTGETLLEGQAIAQSIERIEK